MKTDNDIQMPKRQTIGSAGYDFYMPYDLDMEPGKWYTIDTGVSFTGDEQGVNINFSTCWVMLLMPRSSLGYKYGFRFANTVGVIDQDYIGHNISAKVMVDQPLFLKKGERFMQGILIPYLTFADEISPQEIRDGGHGSTGRE